jgi:hypothetical protein
VARLAAGALASLLVGCACTAIGCANQLRFHPAFDIVLGTTYEITVCLDATCSSASLVTDDPSSAASVDRLSLWPDTDRIEYDLGPGNLGGVHRVTFTISEAGGGVLSVFDDTVELQSSQPNGPFCDPTCWGLDIGLEAAVQAP